MFSVLEAEASKFWRPYRLGRIDIDTLGSRDNKWYILVQIYDESLAKISVSSPSRQVALFAKKGELDANDIAAETEDREPIESIVLWRDH